VTNRLKVMLSNSTCATTPWGKVGNTVIAANLFATVVGQCRLTLQNPISKRLKLIS
jgi:hypothetical protein